MRDSFNAFVRLQEIAWEPTKGPRIVYAKGRLLARA